MPARAKNAPPLGLLLAPVIVEDVGHALSRALLLGPVGLVVVEVLGQVAPKRVELFEPGALPLGQLALWFGGERLDLDPELCLGHCPLPAQSLEKRERRATVVVVVERDPLESAGSWLSIHAS